MWELELPQGSEPIGYRALVELFNLRVLPHYRWSYTSTKWEKKEIKLKKKNLEIHIYPPSFKIDPNQTIQHLEFALKYEGLHLLLLKEIMNQIPKEDLVRYIKKQPTSRYARILWFFYETLLESRLPITDLKKGNYISLLDPEQYYCSQPIKKSRYRIHDNLLGTVAFCPIVRKTPALQHFETLDLGEKARAITTQYNSSQLARAMRYLYTKETLSSWEIEREKPDKARIARFTSLLQKGDQIGNLTKSALIAIQKEIVDPRFALDDYRDFQNYVGEEPALGQLIVHYIAPKPEDLRELIEGLLASFERMALAQIHPIVIAATLAFGFVYLHPFEDGNGRLHRYLIHYTLSKCGFLPEGYVFPISATIVREPRRYDQALETFSHPLLELITDYSVNDSGEMSVSQDTKEYYQFIDFTPIVEYLFESVQQTISEDFKDELAFLAQYDLIKAELKQIVDIPDQKLDLFIRCTRQNGGCLSAGKREKYFSLLSTEEVQQMESVMRRNL